MKFVPEAAMQDRMVLVVCNMKPAKMRDVLSYGMVRSTATAPASLLQPVMPAPDVMHPVRTHV